MSPDMCPDRGIRPPATLRLALAIAVSQPGSHAGILCEDNSKVTAWVPLEDAVRDERAFTVRVASDVLALDQDHDDQSNALSAIAAALRDNGILPVVVASGGDGRRHLFARMESPEQLEQFKHQAKVGGLDVRSYIRPPLVPHRLGFPVQLLEARDPRDALARLVRETPAPHRLSRSMARLLRRGDAEGRYLSRSEVAMAIALGAVNRGWSEEKLYRALTATQNIGGAKVQDILRIKGELPARRYVRRLFARARDRVQSSPPDPIRGVGVRAYLADLRDVAEQKPWRGMAGATDYALLIAHLDIAHDCASLTYTASYRQLAERAAATRKTVARGNRRLEAEGWVYRMARGSGTHGSKWRLLGSAYMTPLASPRSGVGGVYD